MTNFFSFFPVGEGESLVARLASNFIPVHLPKYWDYRHKTLHPAFNEPIIEYVIQWH
jgi:hypothetical protein